ncbi:hypothetical protein, partial [Mangrovicoccus sp. HB161399]|uniref:hypothetical protein n=1 Tax=Mangrovicoccus sp. HB161399 TaxID=2720392 RepID=UPI0020A6D53A
MVAQDPVKAGLRRDIGAPVGQHGHDLAGRQAGEFRLAAGGDDAGALLAAELVDRHRPRRHRALVLPDAALRIMPTGQRLRMQAKLGTGGRTARARGHRLVDEPGNLPVIGSRGHSSSPSAGPQIAATFFSQDQERRGLRQRLLLARQLPFQGLDALPV